MVTAFSGCSSSSKNDSNTTIDDTIKPVEDVVVETTVQKEESKAEVNSTVSENEPKFANYVGSIGNYPIHMSLEFRGNDITGEYGYDSQKPDIFLELTGTVNGDSVELLTTDGREKFIGTLENDRIYGDWFYNDKTLSFEVTDKAIVHPQPNELFHYIGEQNFSFSSGAGGWSTAFTLSEDGTFEGIFADNDMGDNGEKYPDGTRYYSNFKGKFSVKEKLDDFTYVLTLENIKYADKVDTEEYADDVKYIYTTAYGLDADTEFIVCLPGKPRRELSEVVLSWDLEYIWGDEKSLNLPYYALYGVDSENAFYTN